MPVRPDAYTHRQLAAITAQLRQARYSMQEVTADQLAQTLGLALGSVADWERGADYPNMANLILWARQFGFRLVLTSDAGRRKRDPVVEDVPGEAWQVREMRRLGLALQAVRERAGLSRQQVAARVGVHPWSITQWENGRGNPRPAGLVAWANALGYTVRLGRLKPQDRTTVQQQEQPEPLDEPVEQADPLGQMIKQLVAAREQRALSQHRLSVLLGLTKIVVGKWESGIDVPVTEHLIRWAHAVGLNMVLLDPAGKPIEDRPDVLPGESFEHFEVRRVFLALRAVRMDAGFTQKALGAELGVSTRTIVIWENTLRGPRLKHLLAWADRLSCQVVLEPAFVPGAPCGVRIEGC